MTDTKKTPFTMVGSSDVDVCVDGVCEVPQARSAHEPHAGAERVSAQPIE